MSTSIVYPASAVAGTAASMPPGRLLHAYFAEAKYETVRTLRTIAFVLPFLLLPVIIYLMFGVMMTRGAVARNPSIASVMFTGYSVFAIMGPALFSIGVTLANERAAGLMTLKRALPVPGGAYLLAKMLTAMVFAALAMAVMTTTALVTGRLPLSPAQLAVLVAVMIVGALPFCAIGLFIGAHVSSNAAAAVTNLVFLPMTWFSGLFFPPPAFLKPFAVIWPAFHLEQLALAATGLSEFRVGNPLTSVVVLVGVTAVFGGLATRRLARKG